MSTNRKKIERTVRALVRAEVQFSWRGSYTDAEDRFQIDKDLRLAKGRYKKALDEVFAEPIRDDFPNEDEV